MLRVILFLIAFLFVAVTPQRADAQLALTETQALSFGTIVIRSWATVARVTVNAASNNTTYGPGVIGLSPGQRAEYDLTGGPASTAYSVSIDGDTDMYQGLNPVIRLDNFVVRPNVLATNALGQDQLFIGARARTLGGGNVYLDGAYSGSFDFTVQF